MLICAAEGSPGAHHHKAEKASAVSGLMVLLGQAAAAFAEGAPDSASCTGVCAYMPDSAS